MFKDSLVDAIRELKSQTCLRKKCSTLQHILSLLETNTRESIQSLQEEKIYLNELSENLIETCLIKDGRNAQDRDYDRKDFLGKSEIAELVFKWLEQLLLFTKFDSSFLCSVLMLCATHSQAFLWSSQENVALSNDLLKHICEHHNFETVGDLLTNSKFKPPVLEMVLEKMKPTIENDNWKLNPSFINIFKWFLVKIQCPHLTPLFSRVLSPSLRMIDDYRCENKIHGIECICHIVENVPQAELLSYGRADVIYDALFRLTYVREPEIIEAVYPCLLIFLKATEKNVNQPDRPTNPGRYDSVYSTLISNMAHEQRLPLRRVYSIQIPQYIDSLGITVCRHLKRTVLVLCEYLETYDMETEETRLNILRAMNCLVLVAWPRLTFHYESILKSVLRFLYDVLMDQRKIVLQEAKEEAKKRIRECLQNLKCADQKKFMTIMANVLELDEIFPVVDFLRDIMEVPG